jgi:hypothetical protein
MEESFDCRDVASRRAEDRDRETADELVSVVVVVVVEKTSLARCVLNLRVRIVPALLESTVDKKLEIIFLSFVKKGYLILLNFTSVNENISSYQ